MDDKLPIKDELVEILKENQKKFEEKHKDMPAPKYTYGDTVLFMINDQEIIGTIEIVDRYGTFEQNEEPSYDIMVEESPLHNGERCLYKHIRESRVLCTPQKVKLNLLPVCPNCGKTLKDLKIEKITTVANAITYVEGIKAIPEKCPGCNLNIEGLSIDKTFLDYFNRS